MNGLISHYEILEKIGEGGMGAVFKALDRKLERLVAIKLLPAELSASRADRERFVLEAKAASALNHPNILTIHDLDEHEGRLFIVMEFVEGQDLRHAFESGPLPLAIALRHAAQIAEGLAAAQARGIVHCDVKPGNVLVTSDGHVKLADFGLAQFLVAGESTRSLQHAGTPRYMAPEQIEGAEPDSRSDIFSFGAVVYEMLSGRPAFGGATMAATLNAVLHTEPEPLSNRRPETPAALADLIERCLRKDKAERPASFREIASAIAAIRQGGAPGPAPTPALHLRSALPPGAASGTFAGRDAELAILRARIEAALAGRGGAVIVSGEAGIGKTRLVAEAVSRAMEHGPAIFWGRCLHREGGAPYHPFAAALRGALQPLGEPALREIARAAEARGVPLASRLALLRTFLDLPGGSPELANKEQLWDAVYLLLAALSAGRPAIFVLDDLQWADRATLGLFAYVARNAAPLPLLLVATHRGDSAAEDPGAPPLLETVRQLRIEGAAETIALDRLSDAEETAALARLFDDEPVEPALIETVRGAVHGHPLFMVELVKLLREQGRVRMDRGVWRMAGEIAALPVPERVQDVIAQRLERVPSSDREALELASCEGERFHSGVLAAGLGLERLSVLRLLQRLESGHGLVRHEGARYRFDHPLVRQVLYESIIPELRAEYHRMIADHLIARRGGEEEEDARIAYHLLSASREDEAVEYLIRAGDKARALHAMEEALAHYTRAAAIVDAAARRATAPDPRALVVEEGLGDVNASLGKPLEAAAHYERALAAGAKDRLAEAALLRKLADARRVLGESARAEELCREALAAADDPGRPIEKALALNLLGLIRFNTSEFAEALSFSREALEIARTQNDRALQATSLQQIGQMHMHRGESREAIESLERALEIQRETGDPRGLAASINILGLLYYRRGSQERSLAAFEESVRLRQSLGDHRGIPGALNGLGDTYRDLFDLEKAVELHHRSLALAREQQHRSAECDNLRDLGADRLLLGDPGAALAPLEEALSLSRTIGNTWYETRSCITLGETHLHSGHPDEARRFSDLGVEMARRIGAKDLLAEALWGRSNVLARTGRPEVALEALAEAAGLAREAEHRPLLWRILLDLGRRLRSAGRAEESERSLEEARAIVAAIAAEISDPARLARFRGAPDVEFLLGPRGF